MKPRGQYALFDWDNTLRKGFTIISWAEYLCAKKAIREDLYKKLIKQFDLYRARKLSYRQLATTTTEIYAQALSGIELSFIEELAYHFFIEDTDVFPFTGKLLGLLKEEGIGVIIVSGSPKIVLQQYADQFSFSEIYGMDIEVVDNKYTGIVKQDFGADKHRAVEEICYKKREVPLVAFGDSVSDKPLLSIAKYGYFLDWAENTIVLNGRKIAPISAIESVIENLPFSDSK